MCSFQGTSSTSVLPHLLGPSKIKISFKGPGSHLLSHAVSSIVPSAAQVLTIVFGMGTGVDVYKRQVFMLKPADGMEGAVNAILSAVQDAGPNA